jgi:hypothetical protein
MSQQLYYTSTVGRAAAAPVINSDKIILNLAEQKKEMNSECRWHVTNSVNVSS